MKFYLGASEGGWVKNANVPLFVSARRLRRLESLPRAIAPWALDSGGFTELSMYGRWVTTEEDYVRDVRLWSQRIGMMEWAAIMDWMCEPHMLQKTGLTVRQHQLRTVDSLLSLRDMAPELPWVPVLQGWERSDYLRHTEMYRAEGFDLSKELLVGLGSVCRRQATAMVENLARELKDDHGLRLHGFGVKKQGAINMRDHLVSSDSMAWSRTARYAPPLPRHQHLHCNNCLAYALKWREELLAAINP